MSQVDMLICVAEIDEVYYASIPRCLHHQVAFSTVIHACWHNLQSDSRLFSDKNLFPRLMSTVKVCMDSDILI